MLTIEQETTYEQLLTILEKENLERRALGKSDYPSEYPLKEILLMSRHCSGGIILGFSKFKASNGTWKPDTNHSKISKNVKLPSPWNHIEAGILFTLRLPLMVFREDGIEGGVFDKGVTDVFLNKLPLNGFSKTEEEQLIVAIQNWVSRVREHYRKWDS